MKLTAQPECLNVFLRPLAVGDEDNTLFGVGFNPFPAQLIEQVCPACGVSDFLSNPDCTRHKMSPLTSALVGTGFHRQGRN